MHNAVLVTVKQSLTPALIQQKSAVCEVVTALIDDKRAQSGELSFRPSEEAKRPGRHCIFMRVSLEAKLQSLNYRVT